MAQEAKDSKYIVDQHQVRSPTLLIGIGGIGGQIVHAVYDAMSEYDRSRVEMLVMDTNINDLDAFIGTSIHYIQTSENRTVQGYLEANNAYAEWFPVNPLINAKNLSQGAGQIRSVSRLGALASKAEGRFDTIEHAVDRLLTNHGDTLERAARVMIVGSATGGTGSGLGVQLPFYVRNVLASRNVPNVLVRGLFLMPSLTEDVQDTEAKKHAVNVNGYAFLKEVNAFYHAQMAVAEDNVLRIEEYVPGLKTLADGGKQLASAAPVPYDFLFLVEKFGERGMIGGLEDYIARSAQMVINQLFSPVAARGFSAEDNLITSSVPTGGMNRYCGSGISNAIYPKEEVVRYCTVRYAGEMIKGYWLQIDDEFTRRDEQQRRMRKTDSTLDPLDRGETYCKIFDDMCDPNQNQVSSEVAALHGELNVRVMKEETVEGGATQEVPEELPVIDCLVEDIKNHLFDVYTKTGIHKEADGCHMNPIKMQKRKAIQGEIAHKMDLLGQFRASSEKKISALVLSTAEAILPSDLKLAQGTSKDAKHNIYVSLCEKHPIIARYLLYKLRNQLRLEKQESDNVLSSFYGRKSIFTKDYFKEEGESESKIIHRESPREAVSRTPAGMFAWAGFPSGDYTGLVDKIIKDAAAEANRIRTTAEHTLKSTVYRIVLERLDALIELYEMFFEELRDIMEKKGEEAKRLEPGKGSDMGGDYKGDKYICCNTKCKQALYDQFKSSLTESELEMSDEVKHGFFDQMFGEYVTRLVEKENPTKYVTHLSLSQLFEQGILEPITAQFQKKGFRHLDMSILEAIEKQFQIEKRMSRDNTEKKEYNLALQQYITDLCESLRVLAVPYLSYDVQVAGYNSGGKLAYTWGLNHSAVARYQSGTIEQGVNKQDLKDMFEKEETALADESFSPYQLVCYAAIYDLRVENCRMYRVGAKAEVCYRDRLENVSNQAYVINNEKDGYLEVIHPHLDCRWHEHAYLPELMGDDEEKQCKNTRLAFLFAVCTGRCNYELDHTEYLECWRYLRNEATRPTAVFVDGKELKTKSIYSLYKAFDRNRVIVNDMMEYLEAEKEKALATRPEAGITEAHLLTHPLLLALMGKSENSRNVLDLLYVLQQDSGDANEIDRIMSALVDYIYDYCYKMANEHKHKAEAMSQTVRKEIGAASATLNDPNASKLFKASCAAFNEQKK